MNGDFDFFEPALASEDGATPVSAPNPYWQGHRVVDRDDLFPKGFSQVELDATYASLANDVHDLGLLLESPSLDELDYYNPGKDEVEEGYVLEAITVEHFSRTERRMAAVVRVLNRHLSDSEIKALSPVVGKPKKSGSFAYVIVQLPFSDGQTVNVVFHSPEGDKKRIGPSDAIIAFRWLLNKRDITHVVAPEDGEEISLESIAKRIAQLVVKNSARFERQQKAAQAERKELEETREAVKDAEERQSALMEQVSAKAKETETIEARLSNTLSLLEKQKTINAELQAKIDALRKTKPSSGTPDDKGTSEELGLKKNGTRVYDEDVDRSNEMFAKAKQLGLSPQTPSEFMAQVESGNRSGQSLAYLKELLAKYKDDINKLNAGIITARRILGRGTKAEAKQWLSKQISELESEIASGGISNFINLQNYVHYLTELVKNKRDTTFISDEEIERRTQQREEQERQAREDAKVLAAKAEQYKRYEVGSRTGMRSPLEVKFTINSPSDSFLVRLGEAATSHEKYEILKKAESNGNAKRDRIQPNREFDIARALRTGVQFGHFELSPRRGYYVATLTIDTAAPPSPVPSAVPPAYARDLQDILDGKYDADSGRVLDLLDQAITAAENDGKLEEFQALLDAASNHLTDLLAKEAA